MKNLVVFLVFLLSSCFNNNNRESVKYFPLQTRLTGENIGPENYFRKPTRCLIDDQKLVVIDAGLDEFIQIMNYDFDFIYSWGKKGKGPNELMSAPYISKQHFVLNNSLTFFEPIESIIGKIYFANNDSFVVNDFVKIPLPANVYSVQNIQLLANEIYIARGCIDKGKLVFFDTNDSIRRITGFVPKGYKRFHKRDFYTKYYGDITYCEDSHKIAVSNRRFNQIEIYNEKGDLLKEVITDKSINPFSKDTRSNLFCYNAIYSTPKYIYASYLGVKNSELQLENISKLKTKIHVIDWEGVLIAELSLDRLTGYFAVDGNDQFIICIDETNYKQPFVRYDIADVLK